MKYSFLFLLFPVLIFGQDNNFKLPEVIPPSPTVASLMQVEELPVEYYTGQPDISIPIFTKKLHRDKSLDLKLRYSTSGVKVTERSGWVGTGWSLEAGGSISRTVRGVPDEELKNGNILTGIYNLPNNEFFSYYSGSLSDANKGRYGWNVNGTTADKYDAELDLYQYNILGATGRFVVVKENNALKAKLLSKDEKVEISISWAANYKITSFTITDAKGYKYYFGGSSAIDVTTSTPYSSSIPQVGLAEGLTPSNMTTTCTTAWHMTSVRYNSIVLASFSYTAVNEEYENNAVRTTYTPNSQAQYYLQPAMGNSNVEYNAGIFKPSSTMGGSKIKINSRKPSLITFRDGTKVSFVTTSGHPEYDVNSSFVQTGVKLNRIELKDASSVTYKKFYFSYEESSAPRLWLMNLTQTPTDQLDQDAMVHKFEYDQKNNLPGYGLGDGWGYNSLEGLTSFGYTIKFTNGLLERIVYPTGGVTDFTYEPHNFSYEGSTLLSLEETNDNPFNQLSRSTYTDFSVTGNSSSPSYSNVFYVSFDQDISLNITINSDSNIYNPTACQQCPTDCQQCQHRGRYYYEVVLEETNSSGTVLSGGSKYRFRTYDPDNPSSSSINHTGAVHEGYYKYTVKYALLLTPSTQQSIVCRPTFYYGDLKTGAYYTRALLAGGVRIKEINFRDNETTTEAERTFKYYYNEPLDTSFDPGLQSVMPEDELTAGGPFGGGSPSISSGSLDSRNGGYKCEYGLHDNEFLKNPNNGECVDLDIYYEVETNQPHFELTKGSSVGYKYVRVREIGNGYKMFTYTSAQDDPYTNGCTYPIQNVPNFDYKRGLLVKEEIFDETNTIVQETNNTYNIREENIAPIGGIIDANCKWVRGYTNYDQYSQGIAPTNISSNCYSNSPSPYNCGASPYVLASGNLKAGSADLATSDKTEYFYYNGVASATETSSQYEYNTINFQIKKDTKVIEEGDETNTYVTQYEYPVGGYTTSLFTSSENSVISTMAGSTVNMVNKPIVTTTTKNGQQVSRVVDKYAVFSGIPQLSESESIKGTATAEDRMTYSLYDGYGNPLEVSLKDGPKVCYIWGYNDTRPVAKIEGISGYSYISTVNANIINNIKTYSNAATYNEQSLKNSLSDLRSLLPNALVTTITYDLKYGPTTVTDPSGIILNYIYDALGRLKFIKDQNGVVKEHYEYHYRS